MITVDKEEVCGKALGPLSKSELQSLTWSQNICKTKLIMRPRQDSNLQHSDPKSDALSIAPLSHGFITNKLGKPGSNLGLIYFEKIYIFDFVFLYYIVKGHFRNHVSLGPTIVGWTAPGIFYLFQEKILHWPPMYWFLNWNGWFTYPKTKVTVSYKLWFYKIACVDRESNPEQQLGRLLC